MEAIASERDNNIANIVLFILFYITCGSFNYILWLQDLLDSTSANYSDGYDQERDIFGLDM